MINPDSLLPGAERLCSRVVRVAAFSALLVAVSNLAVWFIPDLQLWIARWSWATVMRANTAAAIAAGALSLWIWYHAGETGRLRWAAAAFGALPALIGGLTSLQYLFHLDFGIDAALAAPTFPGDRANAFVVASGRMSLNAAASLFFLGLSLTGLDWRVPFGKKRRIFTAPVFAVVSALPAAFGLVGYLSGTGGFTGLLKSTNILLHTALSLLLLAIGILAVRIDRQPVRRILSVGAGGMLLRWLLPGSTASLIALAWFIGQGREAGHVSPGEGTALMLFGGLILLYGLIVAASRAAQEQHTSAQRANSALRGEEQRSRSILATSLDGVLLLDVEGRVLDWNVAAERLFGWTRAEIIGRLVIDYIMPERLRVEQREMLLRDASSGRGPALGKRVEIAALRRSGTEFMAEWSINSVAGAPSANFVAFVRDITERQKNEHALLAAKEQAERASQAKDDFLAALSHELRTPLTPVLLSTSVLAEDSRLPEDVRHSLQMIERHVTLEARLIDDLLDLTRISRGKLLLRTESCNVHDLINHALEIIRDDAESKGVKVQMNLQSSRNRLFGDPARLQQVFWNLLKNAVKFTPSGGIIQIRSWDDEATERLTVEVRDDGVGFAPGLAERLFLPFEQEKRGETQHVGGLGLGLAIARAIVELHGGQIQAQSEGPGRGASFSVKLPQGAPPEETPIVLDGVREPWKEGRSMKILLVEDHEPTRQVLARLLKRAGHDVTVAGSIAEALAVADAGNWLDVLVSDLGLPDGSGMELMQALRDRGAVVAGIALSGYGMDEDMRRTRQAGFACHLVKPVKFEQLASALSEIQAVLTGRRP